MREGWNRIKLKPLEREIVLELRQEKESKLTWFISLTERQKLPVVIY